MYGLLGENGAGKTTLINTFVGILRGDSGTIQVDGQDVRTLGKAFLSQIGYMPQYPIFYRDFTVKDFLLYMCALKDIPTHEAQNRVAELLATVNLGMECDRRGRGRRAADRYVLCQQHEAGGRTVYPPHC